MKQIYDLIQTIQEDKDAVVKCEKQLHYLKSVLSAHENALERLTNVPTLKENKDTSEKRVRITRENWKDLGIEVGDKVEIVVSGDDDFKEGVYRVAALEPRYYYTGTLFMRLDNDPYHNPWYDYNANNEYNDELYLIKKEK